ncbi:hypothetical protein ND16A_2150 [Thalassotalea sp. ND16A]|nr:hypothetical protein ND16A_2150 [Thalassotalea sp. ND16A]
MNSKLKMVEPGRAVFAVVLLILITLVAITFLLTAGSNTATLDKLKPLTTIESLASVSVNNARALLSPGGMADNVKTQQHSTSVIAEAQSAAVTTSVIHFPTGVSKSWWTQLQRARARNEYQPSENGKGLQAPNRAHNLRTYFDSTGIRVHDRTAAGESELASFSLIGMGRGAELLPVAAGIVTHTSTRVEIQRPGVIEWYENSPLGLEQGFTLAASMTGEGPLVLELAVGHAKASLRGQSIVLTTDAGRRLNYAKLVVTDANGMVLASRLEVPSPQRLQLIVEDPGAAYPVVIDPLITSTADAILESNQPDNGGFDPAAFGGSVAIAGDVNGDGFDDVIVGSRGWDLATGLFDEGAVFVFLGSATGVVGSEPASAHAVIRSDQASAEFGTSVAGAGDVNGDGIADFIVGAPHYEGTFRGDPNLTVKGAAFVFYGKRDIGITATSPDDADARIDANQIDAILGFSVAGAGDVNGDGFDDIIIGAPRQGSPTFPPNIPPNQAQGFGGAAVVFHGSAAGITASGFDDADATLLAYPAGFPEPSGGFMGADVSGAGDVNGDGFDDVLVFIDGAALFLGSATGIVGSDPTTAHAHITGPGSVVSKAGDVNGDGFGDIILGAPGFPDLGNPPGASFERSGTFGVFLGSPAGIPVTDFLQADSLVEGVHATQLASAGDIDLDGFDDVIIGAVGYVGSLNSEGAAYVFRGGPSGIVATSELDAYVRIGSRQSEAVRNLNRYDLGVGGAGDVNGDGFSDVIVGFGFYDVDQINEGAAFVYHGGPAPVEVNPPPVPIVGPPGQVYVDFDNTGKATITVDGLASFDNGFIANYAWLEGETLLGTSPVLTTSLVTSGDHRLVLNVTDDGGLTRGAGVTVRVEPAESDQLFFDDFTIGFGSWLTAGDVTLSSVDTFPDPPQVQMGASGSLLSRTIAMPAGSTGMSVSFQGKASQFSGADELLVKVSVDGGPFTTIHTITSAESNDTYIFYGGSAIPLGHSWFPATAANIVLEFESNMSTGQFFVDLVKVEALLAPPGSQPPLPGELPIANAGVDITVDDNDGDGSELVTLDGTLSFDSGGIESYQWFELTSSGASLLGAGVTLDVAFDRRAIPGVLAAEISGSHTVQLLVTGNDGGSASDTLVVTVNGALSNNQSPVANAGLDLTVTDANGDTLEFVHFDGRGSSDSDGTIVSYNWTEHGNTINNAPTFTITMPIGVHTVQLEVTDNQGATSTDIVVITVLAATPTAPIDSFSGSPTTITAGESAILSWTTTGADSVVINAGPNLPLDGSISVSPTATTLYILTAIGPAGASQALVTVTVNPAPPPPPVEPTIDDFLATPASITAGESATLSWNTTGAGNVSIDNGVGAVSVDGSVTVNPTVTTSYTLSATGSGVTTTAEVTVNVSPAAPAPPTVDSFSASPSTITVGASSTLTWATTEADSVSINGGASQPANGSSSVSPATTTTYELTATGLGGTVTESLVIEVQAAPTGADFNTQLAKMTIPAGASAVVSSAFDAVDPARTIALISGVTQHAMGWTAESTQDPVEISAYVSLGADGTSLTATRASAVAQTDTVWVLLVEYTGSAGGANELRVRDRRVHAWSAGQTSTSYGPISSVVNGNKVVVFAAGSSNPNTASSAYDRGDVRAWINGANTVQLRRGDGNGAISSSHQVVEFVGSNWNIQTGDTVPSPDPGGTDVAVSSVTDVGNAWVYFTWSSNSANLDERGHRLWLTSPTNLRVQEDAAATATKTIRWSVISNPQMQVQSGQADNLLNSTNTATITGFLPVADLAQSFAWVSGMTDGGGNAHPRDMWQFELLDSSTINLQRGRTRQELSYRYFVVELPSVATVPGGPSVGTFSAAPTSIIAGATSTLTWTTANATNVSIDNGIGSQPLNGDITVSPVATTTYTLTAQGTGDPVSVQTTVTVNSAPLPVSIDTFAATPTEIIAGESTSLAWTTSNATDVSIDNGIGSRPLNGSITVSPTSTTTYILTAQGTDGPISAQTTVIVNPAPLSVSIDTFAATSTEITAGESTTLAWTTSNATSVSIDNGIGSRPLNGSITVSPASTTTYILTAQGTDGPISAQITVTVNPAPLSVSIDTFAATSTEITVGESTTLNWTTSNATSVSIDNGIGSQPLNGGITVSPASTTTYILTAQGTDGPISAQITVTVNPAPLPVSVDSFAATSTLITVGESTTLNWTTSNATNVSIDNGVGSQPLNGGITVSPTSTTNYLLLATGAGGTDNSSVTITVVGGGSAQGTVVLSGPTSIDRGDRTSFTVTLTNTGTSTITGAQLSFAVTPNSLLKDVSPGSSVAVGNVPPGGSVSQTWTVRADNEGSGSVSAGAASDGTTLDTVTRSLTVVK